MTYDKAADKITTAKTPQDLFGADEDKARGVYRRLSVAVHPDTVEPSRRIQAEAIFARLSVMWTEYSGGAPTTGFFTITTRKRAYAVQQEGERGGIANVYPATWMEEDVERHGFMKIPHDPRDADLMEAEAKALRALGSASEKFSVFMPELVESFRHRDRATKAERRVNVMEMPDGLVSLADVMDAYPGGIDHRDAAWMFRRLLMALHYSHDVGYIHGAVTPPNVLIHPEEHGLVLVNWCYSVEPKETLRAWDPKWSVAYPPEVKNKEPVSEATDLFMAAQTLKAIVGRQATPPVRAFIRGCTLDSESMRPHDALALRKEYDGLIERLYGPRRFRPFSMPVG